MYYYILTYIFCIDHIQYILILYINDNMILRIMSKYDNIVSIYQKQRTYSPKSRNDWVCNKFLHLV